MTEVTTGRAGAVRIEPLEMNDLARAENHGKRLDESSKARAVYPNAPPLTTTGLDLKQLYREHVDGVFAPKNNTKALHAIVQFPTELVDGEDAEYMLKHARGFVEKVFGTRAIFADRVDRDEQGRHIVDLFLAPIYRKETKHTKKDAVGLSVHTKKLANEYYPEETRIKPDGKVREINVYDIGRSLQDAMFDYLRLDMGLEQALRGSPKLVPGPDWKSAEQLRDQELKEREAQVKIDIAQIDQARREADQRLAAAEAEHKSIAAERARQAKAADEMRAAFRRLELEQENTLARVTKAEAAERRANQAAEHARRDIKLMRNEQAHLALEQEQLGSAMSVLARGIDDRNQLLFRPHEQEERGFTMAAENLLPGEIATYHNWPKALRLVAITMAKMMERMRAMHIRLLGREREADGRAAELQDREQQLNCKLAEMASRTKDLDSKAVAATEQLEAARLELESAQQKHQAQAEWSAILNAFTNEQIEMKIDRVGQLTVTAIGGAPVPKWMLARVQDVPPDWVQTSLKVMKTLDAGAVLLERLQREAEMQSAALKKVVDQANKAFTPAQKDAVAEAGKVLAMSPAQLAARVIEQRDRGLG